MAVGIDGSRLKGYWGPIESKMGADSEKVGDVAYGTYDDIVRGKWARGQRAANEINRRNFDYKGDDISYEILGGKGGQIQNSNSAAYTYGKAMDLDLDSAESGFSWYRMSKLEHQFVNLRHIQHHTGQLADRLRQEADRGVEWVGGMSKPAST